MLDLVFPDITKPPANSNIELLELLEEEKYRKNTNRLYRYYPDDGPLRRELYTKHVEFFAAGATHRERLMLAANRVGKCISGDTEIESPYGRQRKIKDINDRHWVMAWNGKESVATLADKPFIKSREMVYRVWLSNGQYVDIAMEHRFLTKFGWFFLSDLARYVPCLPGTTEDISPLTSWQDVRHYYQTIPDCRDDYFRYCHLYDELFPGRKENGPIFFPLQIDAQIHSPVLSHSDGLDNKDKNTPLRVFVHLSNSYVFLQSGGQPVESEYLSGDTIFQQNHGLSREFEQRAIVGAVQLQLSGEVDFHQSIFSVALESPYGFDNFIVCYQPIGVQDIYDFNVPKYHNYIAKGVIHHNSEGVGGYELTLHLTGDYPEWWQGVRFNKPIKAWAAGDTAKTVRDIIQFKLLGPVGSFGTGLIPEKYLKSTASKQGIADAIEIIRVKSKFGGESMLTLKSYDQRREAFQGTEQDVVWFDEEPPLDIYVEGLMRTMTTGGRMICTFTPLQGISETVLYFLPGGNLQDIPQESTKYVVMATWDDAPHLNDQQKADLWSSIPDYQRDARTKGIPQLGSGAIYPIPESEILIDPFEIPIWYPRVYGLDVGWNRTAAVWGAIDRESDILYLYSEHYRGNAEPAIHAHAIHSRGDWIPGVIDPAARGRGQTDGNQLLQMYNDLGLYLMLADNSKESGIYNVWQRLSFGKLKVFKTLQNWLAEYRLYRRDDKGQIVKQNDHLMDATRYLVMTGLDCAVCSPPDEFVMEDRKSLIDGRNRITGY